MNPGIPLVIVGAALLFFGYRRIFDMAFLGKVKPDWRQFNVSAAMSIVGAVLAIVGAFML